MQHVPRGRAERRTVTASLQYPELMDQPANRKLGHAWLLLCLGLLFHVIDEAGTGFLSVYNPTVLAIRERIPWLPVPAFEFRFWLAGLLAAVALLLAMAPFVYRGAAWTRPIAHLFSGIMILNALGHTAGTIAGRTFASIHFPRPMPGFYSSPFLLAAAVYLLVRLRKPLPDLRTLRAMRSQWDRRAVENARHYVATGQTEWTAGEFFASGEETIRNVILTDMENICQGKDPRSMRVLEIGCGAARVTRGLAGLFGEVHAVDVSGEMVRLAREALASCPNAHVYQNNGMDLSMLPDLRFDFAFSTIVFQHIPTRTIIEHYVRETGRFLQPGALFKFEVHGTKVRPPGFLRRQARKVRRLLWPNDRDIDLDTQSWFGVNLTPRDALRMAEATGFELRYQHGHDTQNYWLWFFKQPVP